MVDWNQQAITEQVERIELRTRKEEIYKEYAIIAGVVVGIGALMWVLRQTRYLSCPMYLSGGYSYVPVDYFITPSENVIVEIAQGLDSGTIEGNVSAALGYVNRNITYISDKKQHGLLEYWSLPRETLKSGYGDCEDFSFLLSSLLLALNLPADTVRVTLGSKDGIGHAWVEVLLNDEWFVLEGARGTMTRTSEADGYNADCFVYRNKCETLNVARYGLHHLVEPLEALALETRSVATKVNDESYITDMYNLIAQTASDARERTFSFCRADGISTTDVNIGNENEVYLMECVEGEKVGDFHTHLDTTEFSVADIINLVSTNHFSCVGAVAENKISCLEVNRTVEGFDEWQLRLYESAVEPLELREWLVYSLDITPIQWLDLYCEYETALTTFEAIISEGMWKGYLVDSTVELLEELSNLS